ncbi:MAG TPA: ABC transporter substrate-binding protein [Stellaceae bacterium]|nr:ABC transporter substrate-binding protein [Stellaceae bacterium]
MAVQKRRLRHLGVGLAVFLSVAAASVPRTALAASGAAGFMTDLGDRVVALIKDKQTPDAQRKQQFAALATQSFDVPKIARFVLGRYWLGASDEQRQQFIQAFESYMIDVYWSRFSQYSGVSFKVTGEHDEGNGRVAVTSEIVQTAGKPPAKVDWWLTPSNGAYKISDISIEGVSQGIAYREEFAAVIERHGGQVAALIDQLRHKANG